MNRVLLSKAQPAFFSAPRGIVPSPLTRRASVPAHRRRLSASMSASIPDPTGEGGNLGDSLGLAMWWVIDVTGAEPPRRNLIMQQEVERSDTGTVWRIGSPGFTKEELRIFVEHRILHIQARYDENRGFDELVRNKMFELRYVLPAGSSRDGIVASLVNNNTELLITVPLGEPFITGDRMDIQFN